MDSAKAMARERRTEGRREGKSQSRQSQAGDHPDQELQVIPQSAQAQCECPRETSSVTRSWQVGGQALREGSEGTRSLKRGRAHTSNSAICTPPRS